MDLEYVVYVQISYRSFNSFHPIWTGVRELWCSDRLQFSETVLWTLPGIIHLMALTLLRYSIFIR